MKVVIDIDDLAYKFVQNTSFAEDESTLFKQTNADREKTLFLFGILDAIKNGTPYETVTEFADRCRECGREKVLDKIRAEIEQEPYVSKMEVLEIIDKYRESEVAK